MNLMDSRALTYTDFFIKRFSSPGTFTYQLMPAGTMLGPAPATFQIEVGPKGGSENQADVAVHWDGKQLTADPPSIRINAGDVVLWNMPDATAPGFTVHVSTSDKKAAFDSVALGSETIYGHAFGLPGEYHWTDAHGGKVGGVIVVRNLDSKDKNQQARWMKALETGVVITIKGGKAEPDKVEILTDQTVFWIIEDAPGISVTDAALLKQ